MGDISILISIPLSIPLYRVIILLVFMYSGIQHYRIEFKNTALPLIRCTRSRPEGKLDGSFGTLWVLYFSLFFSS